MVLLWHFHMCIYCALTTLYHPSFTIAITTFPYLISAYSRLLIDSCLLKRMWLPGFFQPNFLYKSSEIGFHQYGVSGVSCGHSVEITFSSYPVSYWGIQPSQTFLNKWVKCVKVVCLGLFFLICIYKNMANTRTQEALNTKPIWIEYIMIHMQE